MNNPIQKSDKESYIFLCQNEATIPLFMQPDWLDAVCGKELNWGVVLSKNRGGIIDAALVYCLKKKYGITQITMPHFTQFTDFWFLEKSSQHIDYQYVVIEKMLQELPAVHRVILRFHYNLEDFLPFKKNGFQTKLFKTQVIENLVNSDVLYQKLSRDVQRNIKKAGQNFRVITKDNFDILYKLANNVFERQNTPNPIPLSIWKSVHTLIHEKKWGRVYYALDDNNEAHAAVMVVWDAQTMYILASGSTEKGRKYGGMTQLIWQAITDSIGQHETVNFLGSSIPAIEAFNLRFNAKTKMYFSAVKFQNKMIKKLFDILKR
jgi:Acetyltransferase (GNAT) domain